MLQILVHDILPVFAILALGFALGRSGQISRAEASAVNRVAFLVLQPALIFPLISGVDLSAFRADAVLIYAASEAVLFTVSYFVAAKLFGRDRLEAWLLAMAVVFVNSLLYIWPISFLIYGEAAALPITAIVAWDASVVFAFFIVSSDLMSGRGTARQAMGRVATNPVLLAIALGAAVNLAGLSVPAPILTFADFAGAGAAPLTLFALGVILSGQSLVPSSVVTAITALKLVAFPVLVWAALQVIAAPDDWNALFVLNAAGPSGAMAFSLALLHGVRTDAIAPVVIWTSVLSLVSLAWLA